MKNSSVVSSLREPLKVPAYLKGALSCQVLSCQKLQMQCRARMPTNRCMNSCFNTCHGTCSRTCPVQTTETNPSSTEVIEFDNLFLGRPAVICKDAAVGVFSFPQVEFAVYPLLSLNHKTVCLPFHFDENGGQLKLTAQFHFLPTSEGKDVIVERTASVGTDIEGLAVF